MNRLTLAGALILPGLYITACLCIAATIAFPIHLIVSKSLDFHALVGRGAEVLLVLGLLPLGFLMKIGKPQLGLETTQYRRLQQIAAGLAIGTCMLSLHTLLLLALEVRQINPDRFPTWQFLETAGKSLLVAFVIAMVEETVFRGFLLGTLLKKTNRICALLISASYFTLPHFLSTELRPSPGEIHWYTGFLLVKGAMLHLGQAQIDSILALFTSGIFLGLVRLSNPTANLGYCIGIHAGWVFVIKSFKSGTLRHSDTVWAGWVSNFDGVIGYLSITWLSVVIMLLIYFQHQRSHSPASDATP